MVEAACADCKATIAPPERISGIEVGLMSFTLRLIVCSVLLVAASAGSAGDKPQGGDGWKVLFDGTSVDAFRGYRTQDFPKESWSVEGDTLKANPSHPLDLITREQFADFELELEWKVEKEANSGIMYHVSEDFPETYMTGPEMQVVDDDNTDDGKDPKTSAGSLYALIAAKDKKYNPFGQWNKVRIRVSG